MTLTETDRVSTNGASQRLHDLEAKVERQAVTRDTWTLFIFIFAAVALLASVIGVGLAARSVADAKRIRKAAGASTGGTSAPTTAMVHLSELKIEPASVTIAAGGTLQVMNLGAMAHNLAIKDA